MMWCPCTRRGKKNQRMTEPRLGMTKSNGKYNHFGRLASLPKLNIHKSHERFILLLPTRPFVMRPPMRCLVFWELKWPLTPPLLPRATPGRSMTRPAEFVLGAEQIQARIAQTPLQCLNHLVPLPYFSSVGAGSCGAPSWAQ